MEAIFNRQSIRKFTDEPVKDEDIKTILRAAMQAPSAGNQQPWDFIVIKNQETMNKILEISPYATPLKQAQVAIVVCGDEEKERFKGYWVQDCSAAIQNMLIQSTFMGLGSVWLGIYPEQDRVDGLRSILNIPESVTPLSIVALGHPGEERRIEDRYKEERIHNESW